MQVTLRQQAGTLLQDMSDDDVQILVELMKRMQKKGSRHQKRERRMVDPSRKVAAFEELEALRSQSVFPDGFDWEAEQEATGNEKYGTVT